VSCTDGEFNVLCRQLNAVVGKGSDFSTRLWHAVDAVEKKQLSTPEAASTFYVSKSAIQREIREKRSRTRIEMAVGSSKPLARLSNQIVDALAVVQADSVIKRAVELSQCCNVSDTVDAISKAKQLPEKEAVELLEQRISESRSNRKVKSKERLAFLRALGMLENATDNKTFDSLDIRHDERSEVRKRCKAIANTLNLL
jgi:hypothetical protein